MWFLGISAYYHDSAAAIINDGEIIAAAQEERFTRKKHDAGFPRQAIRYCLQEAGLQLGEIDRIIFYDKPFLKFERLLETYVAFAPRGFGSFIAAMPLWLKEKLFQKKQIIQGLLSIDDSIDPGEKLLFTEHHLAHAASCFFPSPFDEALILTMDGVGEWATTTVMRGSGNTITPLREIHFPHSLGLLYSAFTYFTGFRVNSGEYKLMGLAPYGQPVYADLIRDKLIDIHEDGSFRLNMRYFDYCTGLRMTNKRFAKLFGRPPRRPGEEISRQDMDLASSIQAVTEDIVLRMAESLRKEYKIGNLCLAGGVALNCVANGKLLRADIFDNVWVQPAAGDAGGALGAAYSGCFLYEGLQRTRGDHRDRMQGSYLGPVFDNEQIRLTLDELGAKYHYLDRANLIDSAARALTEEKAIGWFQGRMEFGPRALGARSILGDPRSGRTQSVLNVKIKYRESFRPFAPSVLREDVDEYFELDQDSPYMQFVVAIAEDHRKEISKADKDKSGIELLNIPRSDIPAVTHVDYTARIQTVHKDTNSLYYDLIQRFKALTGYGLVVNTSFNIRGEPIVCTPADAFRCFMGTEMDELYIGNYRLIKEEQDPALKLDYKRNFELD